MKRIIALLLICTTLLVSCSSQTGTNMVVESQNRETGLRVIEENLEIEKDTENITNKIESNTEQQKSIDFSVKGLDDEVLLQYVEDNVYIELINQLNSEEYFVENIEAIYYPKEYIEVLAFNSKSNLYFGYTAEELDEQFQGIKYVFTLGSDGKTSVVPMETLSDDVYVKALEDVIIGSGVILVCVTVSIVSAPTAPAVSMIFAASATTGTAFALESSALSFVAAAITKGYETESFEQGLLDAIEASGEGFKWGAITGVITGGLSETFALKGATRNGLTMNEAAKIQKETKWPLDAIKAIHSYDEFKIYQTAGVQPIRLDSGKYAFIRDIDWKLVDSQGRTNVERVLDWEIAPIDSSGKSYELHHIGQKADSPLAILTWDEHHVKGNYRTLHYEKEGKNITAKEWEQQKKEFWLEILKIAKSQGKV